MDVIGGLTAARLALDLAKDLRGIDRSVDEATFKLKLAELTTALADTQVALAEARTNLLEKDTKIASLEGKLDELERGEKCPRCKTGRMNLVDTKPMRHWVLSSAGVERWSFVCSDDRCNFRQVKTHDPHSVLQKFAGRP
jgi:hypothetical protein